MDDDTTSTADSTAPEADTTEETSTDDPRLVKARKDAAGYRSRLREAESRLAEFEKAQQEKAEADKTEAEKRAAAEQRAVDAELRALRLEVAHEKGLTATQAKRLVGNSREDLESDADEILRDFPARPKAPKADQSQGNRGNKPASGRDAAMAEIQKRFGTKSTVT